jgi:hypothetical protein
MDDSVNPPNSTSLFFTNATIPHHMNPKSLTPDQLNVYQSISVQPRAPHINSDMSIAASTVLETFQSDINDVKEDFQELETDMQTIQ